MAGKSDKADNGDAPATPKAAAFGGGYDSLTTREQEILGKAMTCLKVAPEIDFPMLAGAVNMTNPRSAVNAWSQIKKKMGWTMKAPESPGPAKTPGTGKGKRKVAVIEDDAADDDEDAPAPAKRVKGVKKSGKKPAATLKKAKGAASPESEEDKAVLEEKAEVTPEVKDETPDGEA
ncbi:hypothetical protein KVR01_003317 [Diaporthe batatas]|uniref:uncharacterized protein n=1 Tax=Diaporthe batatas TaxID=748121 RepID=UPI001D03AE28|nr:uncharacterized protein KVR01_003317 [Diaporthe batatas]KAG8167628.1 hypothetical protein KVR01_003317 [Diaporthe batatas]